MKPLPFPEKGFLAVGRKASNMPIGKPGYFSLP
jgi:hypothetical protein